MNKISKLFILSMMTIIPIYNVTNAASMCTSTTCPVGTSQEVFKNCATDGTNVCYKNTSGTVFRFTNCASCNAGMVLSQVVLSNVPGNHCNNLNAKVSVCCYPCSTCINDINAQYSATGTAGYERKPTKSCSCFDGCQTSYIYRCAAGYYGSSTDGTSGCNRCPKLLNSSIYGASAAGSEDVTNCYMPAGTVFSNSTGSGVFTEDCQYSNTLIVPDRPIINPPGGEIVEPILP